MGRCVDPGSDHELTCESLGLKWYRFVFIETAAFGCPNTRHCTMSHYIFLSSNHVSWYTKKQVSVTQYGTKAKYMTLFIASLDIFWVSYILDEVRFPLALPCSVYYDNMGVI
ncbi:uncharacterized protein LOC111317729 [Durio zibethinus]|uniref:Uncharacterized protein LOC111317729 n=1 Tax=Durio zibethinus TaxID=66656 RepID=A0A6P6BFN7_DURZI|nr:uncharacterized protein LOC111317729 [Durio zibethinus]